MPETLILRHVQHETDNLVKLVSDVEAYPRFIKLMSAVRVRERQSQSDTHERLFADVTVSYKFIRERFSCQIDVDEAAKKISVVKDSDSGAVDDLMNMWAFYPLSDGSSLVDFSISVSLKSKTLDKLLRDKFAAEGQKIMTYFEKEADKRYTPCQTGDVSLEKECRRLGLDYSRL